MNNKHRLEHSCGSRDGNLSDLSKSLQRQKNEQHPMTMNFISFQLAANAHPSVVNTKIDFKTTYPLSINRHLHI